MNIVFVISSLSAGGAERVISTMANYWAEKGWKVSLITFDKIDSDFYELHPHVNRIALDLMIESSNLWTAIKNNLTRITRLRREIKATNATSVISFMDKINILTILATFGLNMKVIVSERIDPTYHDIGNIWSYFRKITYSFADVIVGQSSSACRWLKKEIGRVPVIEIPNSVQITDIKKSDYPSLSGIIKSDKTFSTVIGIGRLDFQKGFDLLLKAFAKASQDDHPNWNLIILGEGKERKTLVRLATELGISDRVYLPGTIKNPAQILRQADLFVMSSRYEGFPNALMEAMLSGLPVISFNCPSGPGEIIRDGVDGILVSPEDVDALADTMSRLMTDEMTRHRLAAKAPEVAVRFGVEKIMEIWQEILEGDYKKHYH